MRLVAALLLFGVHAACAASSLSYERALESGDSFTAYLVSYPSDGLKVHAMVAVPKTPMPAAGFPVVVANHGYTPDPTQYGITAAGLDSRPGDYYRAIPELYASRGFMVVWPDYRGHGSSEGFEQIREQNRQAVALYADDVIALVAKLHEIEHANLSRVFMWSHSMGGRVAMRALLATDIIKASSFWATMNVDDLADRFHRLNGPVMIQHSRSDQSVPYDNALGLAAALEERGLPYTTYTFEGSEHLFTGAASEAAADRDAEFFRRAP